MRIKFTFILIFAMSIANLGFGEEQAGEEQGNVKGYRVYLGAAQLPLSVSGLEDAYLNDYAVSFEFGGSEATYVPYSAANGDANSGFVIGVSKETPEMMENTEVLLEATVISSGETSGSLFGLGGSYMLNPTDNLIIAFSPKLGVGSVTKDLGVLPYFWGQINVPEGDFDSGAPVQMSASGTGIILDAEVRYSFAKIIDAFFSLGFATVSFGKPKVTIDGVEISSQVHARSCTGASSVNLYCSNYFDPFASAKIEMSGVKITAGGAYKF